MSGTVLGVGILGAGPVVQAIHLPTLARLRDRFAVRNIMDVDPAIAASVAGRVGAAASTSVEQLLADATVDVVAVCSPGPFHADQVIAAMHAGKKAVLCEKPFAQTRPEAARIAAASTETGVPVIVGAMHAFDPGWLAAEAAWGDLPDTAHTIRSRIIIPPNDRFEDWATEVITRPQWSPADTADPDVRAAMIHGAVLGLAIHDLPLVRRFLPDHARTRVQAAELLDPYGYVIDFHGGDRLVQMMGAITAQWEPSWTLDVYDDRTHLNIRFTPSYVHAGSATATLTREGIATTFGPFVHNGYEGEWRTLHDLVADPRADQPRMQDLIDDLTFAVDVADHAADAVRGAAR